jgi:hypothetical protein
MNIQLTRAIKIAADGVTVVQHTAGDEVSVPDDLAEGLIAEALAVPVTGKAKLDAEAFELAQAEREEIEKKEAEERAALAALEGKA